MGTTNRGLVYPDASDSPERKDIQRLAESVENTMLTGVVNVSGSSVASGGSVSVSVTFSRAFASAPRVVACGASWVTGGSFLSVRQCSSVTTTGFVLHIQNNGSAAATWTNFQFQWIAIGEGTIP